MRLRLKVISRVYALAFGIFVAATETPVLGQCEVQRLTTDDTAPPWVLQYGTSVAVSGNRAVVGAKYVDGRFTVSSGFAYVYRREGARWVQEARLSPSDGTDTDRFGQSVSISGDHLVVSAWGAQAAYVFAREESGWVEDAKLTPGEIPWGDSFGRPVSVCGDVVVVGAESDDQAGPSAGAAYVFRREGTDWIQEQKLMASDADRSGAFGRSVAVDGDHVLVGCPGCILEDRGSGWAYVFRYDGTNWVEEDHLIGSDTAIGDRFGNALALSGVRGLTGAPSHDDPAENVGASYIFRRQGTDWVQEAKLTPARSREGDHIGILALDSEYALLGDGGNDDIAYLGGVAYGFKRSGDTWVEAARLRPREQEAGDFFGSSAGLADGYALIAAPGDHNTERNLGAVYSFNLAAPCRSLGDYAVLQTCFSGQGGGIPIGCEPVDVDPDGDVDLDDYAKFLQTFVGPRD